MKKITLSILSALALTTASSHATLYILSGSLDPQQAFTNGGFGGGSGSGTGSISGSYDDVTNLLNYEIEFSNLIGTVTVMHFHNAPAGSSGGVALGIPDEVSPSVGSNVLLDATQENQLLAGTWYVNIHTSVFGGGEIRGQVTASQVPEPSSAILSLSALSVLLLRRRR
ncbi:MAG: CHRD domain-containing protein [Verrucomicrobiota bacterium]